MLQGIFDLCLGQNKRKKSFFSEKLLEMNKMTIFKGNTLDERGKTI